MIRLSAFTFFAMIFSYSIGMTASYSLAETTLKAMRLGKHPDKTRLVLELTAQSDFRSFVLSDPYRLVLDVKNLNWTSSQILPPAKDIKTLRMAMFDNDKARLVAEFTSPHLVKSAFMLPASKDKPARLVVDFAKASLSEFNVNKARIHGTLPPPNDIGQIQAPSQARLTSKKGDVSLSSTLNKPTFKALTNPNVPIPSHKARRDQPLVKPLIMIDAGHGGQDSGAVNGSIYEKNIALSMVRVLKEHLERTGRYRVQLTRNSDVFLKLYQRVALARRADADLFISVHADSIRKSTVRGASIYTLSDKASDKQTARLAARENQSDTIAGIDLSVEDQDVANILIDLSMRETMNQSKYFANAVVSGMKAKGIQMLQNPHRYAGFAVLKAPDIPSVLVEIGFVSHKKEVRKLLTRSHQDKLAAGIIEGIDRYFNTLERNANAQ
jgi:N-acetylmuramoyl-L-alanine amidase